jgi:hypothetical protein
MNMIGKIAGAIVFVPLFEKLKIFNVMKFVILTMHGGRNPSMLAEG